MNPGGSDSFVPDNVKFFEMTEEQQAIILMWYALKLPVEWYIEATPGRWTREKQHELVAKYLKTRDNEDVHRRCCFRLVRS